MDFPSILHPRKMRNLKNFFLNVEQLGQSQRFWPLFEWWIAEEKADFDQWMVGFISEVTPWACSMYSRSSFSSPKQGYWSWDVAAYFDLLAETVKGNKLEDRVSHIFLTWMSPVCLYTPKHLGFYFKREAVLVSGDKPQITVVACASAAGLCHQWWSGIAKT